MKIEHPQYVGQVLIEKGFRAWFKYMFYVVEGHKFIEEGLHKSLFDEFEEIYDCKVTRSNINIPPRS